MSGCGGRRTFLAGLAALAGAAALPARGASAARTRLILLGTGGGPRARRNSSAPAQVIVVGERAYVVDCGSGVGRQLAFAGVPLTSVRHVFITHHHSDHNMDYGNLILQAWAAGLRTRLDAWGPPPLAKITRLFFEMNAYPPVTPAFAYRFDARDRSIVISGDSTPCDALVELARGADVLVHEALYEAAIDRLVARVPNAATFRWHFRATHTSAADAGRAAAAAGVKTLVLSHFVPPDDSAVTDGMWRDAARAHFRGRVIVGKDLMEI